MSSLPTKFPGLKGAFPTLAKATKEGQRKPYIGLTQGGSSRKGAPAKVAATDGAWRPSKLK